MRPVGSLFDLLVWRIRFARAGLIMRVRSLFSILVVFGGVGVAIGYSIVSRFGRGLDPDDEAGTKHDVA